MKFETSARVMRKFGCFSRWPTFESTPVIRLSSASTSQPSAIRRSHKCDPRNPAPPVTTARMRSPPKFGRQSTRSLGRFARCNAPGMQVLEKKESLPAWWFLSLRDLRNVRQISALERRQRVLYEQGARLLFAEPVLHHVVRGPQLQRPFSIVMRIAGD